jgi:hypothetical protein
MGDSRCKAPRRGNAPGLPDEMWHRTLRRRLLERGDFSSVDRLEEQLLAFISTYNERDAHPYRWTYTGAPLAA